MPSTMTKSAPTIKPVTKVAVTKVADLAKLGSDPTRMHTLLALLEGPLGLDELSEATGSGYESVCQHAKLLRVARLIQSDRTGHRVVFELTAGGRIFASAVEAIC
jgi:DNA-binding transcriptional ArsR family regulator